MKIKQLHENFNINPLFTFWYCVCTDWAEECRVYTYDYQCMMEEYLR